MWLVPLVRSASRLAPIGGGVEGDADARRAGDGADDAAKGDRPVHAAAALEARAEIEDFGDGAVGVGKAGGEDGGVAKVALLDLHLVFERDAPFAARQRRVGFRAEQGAEERIAVDARLAAPDEAGRQIDQSRDLAIADRPEGEVSHRSGASSQAWTASTPGSR